VFILFLGNVLLALPAKVHLALRALHMVAPFSFLNGGRAVWTSLVVGVILFLELLEVLVFHLLYVSAGCVSVPGLSTLKTQKLGTLRAHCALTSTLALRTFDLGFAVSCWAPLRVFVSDNGLNFVQLHVQSEGLA
jgi:hypothetical protein